MSPIFASPSWCSWNLEPVRTDMKKRGIAASRKKRVPPAAAAAHVQPPACKWSRNSKNKLAESVSNVDTVRLKSGLYALCGTPGSGVPFDFAAVSASHVVIFAGASATAASTTGAVTFSGTADIHRHGKTTRFRVDEAPFVISDARTNRVAAILPAPKTIIFADTQPEVRRSLVNNSCHLADLARYDFGTCGNGACSDFLSLAC